MPMPVSSTSINKCSSFTNVFILIEPPFSVYLKAFDIRFIIAPLILSLSTSISHLL